MKLIVHCLAVHSRLLKHRMRNDKHLLVCDSYSDNKLCPLLVAFMRPLGANAYHFSVCPERRRTTRVRGTTPRSHHADLTTSSLATRATASIVQNRCPYLPMSERPGTVVPGGRLSARLRYQATSTPFV